MKQIILQSITLRNWRGEKERTTTFHTDTPTTICGDNGLGKSRHFDAFCWLLFGKDRQDRKDYELRTHDADGNILHHCECSVSATLLVDGEPLTLKREYKEQWVKPRGQIEEVFKGNVTECTWNDVPVKVGDFSKRVAAEIIDDTLFKMITNPHYFAEKIKWNVQREYLLQMAGTATDEEIAATNKEFAALLDTLNGKSLADYRKQIAAEKKRLKAQAEEIPVRMEQTERMMPEAEDWSALATQLDDAKQQLADVDKQVSSVQDRNAAKAKEVQEKYNTIFQLQRQQQEVIEKHRKQEAQIAEERNSARREIEARIKTVCEDMAQNNTDRKRVTDRIDYLKGQMDELKNKLDRLRKAWYEISAMEYTGSDVCPYCGQLLPEDKRATLRKAFEEHKKDCLALNNKDGQEIASQYKTYKTELDDKVAEATRLGKAYDDLDNELEGLYIQLKDTPKVTPPTFSKIDVPGNKELQQQIDDLQAQLDCTTVADSAVLNDKRKVLAEQIDDLNRRLAKQEQIDKATQEIVNLDKQGRKLAQQIADVEKREYVANEFMKAKIADCEQRINNMFSLVTFRLFDCTLDGNEYEICTPYVNGIPYNVTNTAGQVNAGLDIINTLCRFNNVCAPIFIDGAESVNHYIDVPSQTILLQVTEDKQLTIC